MWRLTAAAASAAPCEHADAETDWYHPADAFDRVYAVSDLHGDVDVLLELFQTTLRVVTQTPSPEGRWVWTAPPRTCAGQALKGRSRRRSARANGARIQQHLLGCIRRGPPLIVACVRATSMPQGALHA